MEKEGEGRWVPAKEIFSITGAHFVPWLEMQPATLLSICKRGKKLRGPSPWDWLRTFWGFPRREIGRKQIWRGSYFQKEIESLYVSDVTLRWINPEIGWGVFARRNFKAGEYIAEYTGVVRKRKRSDEQNGYCFEYVHLSGEKTSFLIDARESGGISRYINHSEEGNLEPKLATIGTVTHVLLLTKKSIQKGEQLCYDYGPAYWAHRPRPVSLERNFI